MSKGAGGSNGGLGSFIIGFVMMCGGFYLLLNANNNGIRIDHNLGVVCRWAGIVLTIVTQV
jgi:hypothetical protein